MWLKKCINIQRSVANLAALTVWLTLSVASISEAQNMNCKFEGLNDEMNISATVNGRSINVLGWNHSNPEKLMGSAQSFIRMATAKINGGSCDSIEKYIDAGLIDQQRALFWAADLLNRLQEFKFVSSDTILGVEVPSTIFQKALENPSIFFIYRNAGKFSEIFSEISHACPGISAKKITNLKSLVIRPLDQFWLNQSEAGNVLKMDGFDDLFLWQKSSEISKGEASNFDLDNEKLPAQSKEALRKIERNMRYLQSPSQPEMERAVADIHDLSLKNKVTSYLSYLNELAELGRQRNIKIVKNILVTNKNIIFVVGYGHIAGLREEIKKRCLVQN